MPYKSSLACAAPCKSALSHRADRPRHSQWHVLTGASASYFQPQLAGNVGGNVVLQGSDIGGFALVLLTPDLRAIAHIYHLSFHVERVPVLRKTAYNYSSHLQVASDLQRILLCLPVAENRTAGHHAEPL